MWPAIIIPVRNIIGTNNKTGRITLSPDSKIIIIITAIIKEWAPL